MKVVYRAFVTLLVIAVVGMAASMIVKSNRAVSRSRYTIAQADEFLRRYERTGR